MIKAAAGYAGALGLNVKTLVPNRIILILASIAFVLISIVIVVNYFRGGAVQFAHVLLALGLLAYVVWFSGRRAPEE
jgi:uncharacterized membrane protein YobD (UPF0266 family)